jgi:hypothetical protein
MSLEKAVTQFVDAARSFCAWLEAPSEGTEHDQMCAIRLLGRLYAQAAFLPEVNGLHLGAQDRIHAVPVADVDAIRERLASLPVQYYWEIFNSLTEDPEKVVAGDITDDFGDIYKDVKEGLLTYDAGLEVLAIWHWRQTWGFHWGRHAVSAIKVLHELVL